MAASELTKKAINQAFLDILAEKPLEKKITVRDITERCAGSTATLSTTTTRISPHFF